MWEITTLGRVGEALALTLTDAVSIILDRRWPSDVFGDKSRDEWSPSWILAATGMTRS
jgi:hypothetical protein